MKKQTKPLDSMAIYAEGIDTSDYVVKVTPIIQSKLGCIGDLLDVGAGGGQLGAALATSHKRWVAIEPDAYMGRRLATYASCSKVIASGWEQVTGLANNSFDTVLAANMIAPQAAASQFLAFCRSYSKHAIVWIVPSQRGPKKICLTGCLLTKWLPDETETGYERVMSQLVESEYPSYTQAVDWTFTYITKDLVQLTNHLANNLGWDAADPRRAEAYQHLLQQAEPHQLSYVLKEPKQSTMLVWFNN